MKINGSGLERYQSVVSSLKAGEAGKGKGKAPGRAAEANTDKVTISGDAARRAEVSRAASGIAAEVDAGVGAERIEALRTSVQNGSYHVAAEDIADAILERVI